MQNYEVSERMLKRHLALVLKVELAPTGRSLYEDETKCILNTKLTEYLLTALAAGDLKAPLGYDCPLVTINFGVAYALGTLSLREDMISINWTKLS